MWKNLFRKEFCVRIKTISFHVSFTLVSLFDCFQSAGKFFGRVDAPVMQQLIRSDENSTTGFYNKWVHIKYGKLENTKMNLKPL